MHKKKETHIIVFYILYFSWLFFVTYLTPDPVILNIFTVIVSIFYFVFLREGGDVFWFWVGASFPVLTAITSFSDWRLNFDLSPLAFLPLWLPLAWGTTIVALRKFFLRLSH